MIDKSTNESINFHLETKALLNKRVDSTKQIMFWPAHIRPPDCIKPYHKINLMCSACYSSMMSSTTRPDYFVQFWYRNLTTVWAYAKTPSSALLEEQEGGNLFFIELYFQIYLTCKITLQRLLRTRKTKHTSLNVKNLVFEVKCLSHSSIVLHAHNTNNVCEYIIQIIKHKDYLLDDVSSTMTLHTPVNTIPITPLTTKP